MDTYVHSMDEHKRHEMDKMDDMFGMQYSISVENQPYPVLCTLSPDGCTAQFCVSVAGILMMGVL